MTISEQDNYLLENYLRVGPKVCATLIGKDSRYCSYRAHYLGIGGWLRARRKVVESCIANKYRFLGTKKCAAELGISEQRVRNLACDLGMTGRRERIRYSDRVNAEFFDVLSLENLYVLGFIYADGCIQENKVSFYQNDKSLLEKIQSLMRIKASIRPHGKRCHILSVNNLYMADRLKQIGVRERKSFGNMVCPSGIPDALFHAFFRGFFDGDGSVGMYGRQKKYCRVSVYAEEGFARWMFAMANRIVGLSGGGVNKAGATKMNNFYVCRWEKRDDVRKIFAWMYREDRKSTRLNSSHTT
jgi:hypothetical protein